MIFQKDILSESLPYPLPDHLPEETAAFLDLETKGFARKNSSIQYLGLLIKTDGYWTAFQWILERPEDEATMLREFLSLFENVTCLIHYNGISFDLPVLTRQAKKYELLLDIDHFRNLDLYRLFQPLKKLLNLTQLDQRSLESYLFLERSNLLDNDLIMLPKLLPLYAYLDLLHGGFTVQHAEYKKDSVTVKALLHHAVPNPFSLHFDYGYLSADKTELHILIHGISDTLKYFFPDYKNYFYLPEEDTAIHKSVSAYVDKEHRIPAKAATCYQKKSGFFLPLSNDRMQPAFSRNYKDGQWYLLCDDSFLSNPVRIHTYLLNCLQSI